MPWTAERAKSRSSKTRNLRDLARVLKTGKAAMSKPVAIKLFNAAEVRKAQNLGRFADGSLHPQQSSMLTSAAARRLLQSRGSRRSSTLLTSSINSKQFVLQILLVQDILQCCTEGVTPSHLAIIVASMGYTHIPAGPGVTTHGPARVCSQASEPS